MDGTEAAHWTLHKRRNADPMREVLDRAGAECMTIAGQLGFPYFHLAIRTVAPPGIPLKLVVDGGPMGFHEACSAHFDRPDEMHRGRSRMLPLRLMEAAHFGVADPAAMMAQYRVLGISDGIVVPLHGPRSSHALLTLMGASRAPEPAAAGDDLLRRAQWLSLTMFAGTIDGIAAAWKKNKSRQLTPRQRRALSLAASGKVLSEIAETMAVHPSTARYLVTRATEKLGAQSRMEAVLRSAALDDFDQAAFPLAQESLSIVLQLPPSGKAT